MQGWVIYPNFNSRAGSPPVLLPDLARSWITGDLCKLPMHFWSRDELKPSQLQPAKSTSKNLLEEPNLLPGSVNALKQEHTANPLSASSIPALQ